VINILFGMPVSLVVVHALVHFFNLFHWTNPTFLRPQLICTLFDVGLFALDNGLVENEKSVGNVIVVNVILHLVRIEVGISS